MASNSGRLIRRNDNWKTDERLKTDLESYVKKNFKRIEILDCLKENYPEYAWSLRTLGTILSYFEINYINYDVPIEDVEKAVRRELSGPGKLLGYRAVHRKIRELHGLKVPRDLVYDMMETIDPDGLRRRSCVGKKKNKERNNQFKAEGSDFTLSLDGHDKLCGYQKSTFPLCVYGGQDTYSGRMNFLRIWNSNNNPKVIGRFYIEYLMESKKLPVRIRVDRGTETDVMTTIHCYLLDKCTDIEDPTNNIVYGPSTQNKIERLWRELHHRMELFFKEQLHQLLESGSYDPGNEIDRQLLSFVFIPIIQKELDIFRQTVWNNHRGRKNKNKDLPCGIPEHIYLYPEQYGGQKCHIELTDDLLVEVLEHSGLTEVEEVDDYIDKNFRARCDHLLNITQVEANEASEAFLYLKENF